MKSTLIEQWWGALQVPVQVRFSGRELTNDIVHSLTEVGIDHHI